MADAGEPGAPCRGPAGPGMIFGTGAHASTQMCMQALEQAVRGGERVIDLGSGSGILSITALLLGAASATGVDIDPKAEDIARDNAAMNGLTGDKFQAVTADVLADRGRWMPAAPGGMRSSWPISWRTSLFPSRCRPAVFAPRRAVSLLRHSGPAAGRSASGHSRRPAGDPAGSDDGRLVPDHSAQGVNRTCAALPPRGLFFAWGLCGGFGLP